MTDWPNGEPLSFQAMLNGIDSVSKVLQSFRDQGKFPEVVEGYLGVLIENFDCEKTFFTSVEVTAGSRWVLCITAHYS